MFYIKKKPLIFILVIFNFVFTEIIILNNQSQANSFLCEQLIVQIEFKGLLWNDSATKWKLVLKNLSTNQKLKKSGGAGFLEGDTDAYFHDIDKGKYFVSIEAFSKTKDDWAYFSSEIELDSEYEKLIFEISNEKVYFKKERSSSRPDDNNWTKVYPKMMLLNSIIWSTALMIDMKSHNYESPFHRKPSSVDGAEIPDKYTGNPYDDWDF